MINSQSINEFIESTDLEDFARTGMDSFIKRVEVFLGKEIDLLSQRYGAGTLAKMSSKIGMDILILEIQPGFKDKETVREVLLYCEDQESVEYCEKWSMYLTFQDAAKSNPGQEAQVFFDQAESGSFLKLLALLKMSPVRRKKALRSKSYLLNAPEMENSDSGEKTEQQLIAPVKNDTSKDFDVAELLDYKNTSRRGSDRSAIDAAIERFGNSELTA